MDRTRVQQVSVRRNRATAIIDFTANTTRCYAPEDRAELRPKDTCPELSELITLHRQTSLPIGSAPPNQPPDPELIEKMRALGYLE